MNKLVATIGQIAVAVNPATQTSYIPISEIFDENKFESNMSWYKELTDWDHLLKPHVLSDDDSPYNGVNFFDEEYQLQYLGKEFHEDLFSFSTLEGNYNFYIPSSLRSEIQFHTNHNSNNSKLFELVKKSFKKNLYKKKYIDSGTSSIQDTYQVKIKSDNIVEFRSSWGVENSDSGSFSGYLDVEKAIIESELRYKANNQQDKLDISLVGTELAPFWSVDAPIEHPSISVDYNFEKNHHMSWNPKLPDGSTAGSEWWHSLTSAASILSGPLISIPTISFEIGSSLSNSNLMNNADSHYQSVNDNFNKDKIRIRFIGTYRGDASASSIFGDHSELIIKSLIAKLSFSGHFSKPLDVFDDKIPSLLNPADNSVPYTPEEITALETIYTDPEIQDITGLSESDISIIHRNKQFIIRRSNAENLIREIRNLIVNETNKIHDLPEVTASDFKPELYAEWIVREFDKKIEKVLLKDEIASNSYKELEKQVKEYVKKFLNDEIQKGKITRLYNGVNTNAWRDEYQNFVINDSAIKKWSDGMWTILSTKFQKI